MKKEPIKNRDLGKLSCKPRVRLSIQLASQPRSSRGDEPVEDVLDGGIAVEPPHHARSLPASADQPPSIAPLAEGVGGV